MYAHMHSQKNLNNRKIRHLDAYKYLKRYLYLSLCRSLDVSRTNHVFMHLLLCIQEYHSI